MIPWGTREKLSEDELYNRNRELDYIKNLLKTTANGNPPQLLLTGIRGVGKTVFLKKIKKDLEDDFLVIYVNFSNADCYQKNKVSVNGLLEYLFKQILIESKKHNLNTFDKRIEKIFKLNDFKVKEFININKFPVTVFEKDTNTEKLMDFVLTLPHKIYEENNDKIKGILIFIDEFQIIKELNDYKESFLWKLRSYVQNDNNVSYTFSGSMSLHDELISEIASQHGVFGGCMLSINLSPFDKDTVKSYLEQKAQDLLFTGEGFEIFYECTSGIPAYVNIFAILLPKNIVLDKNMIIKEFDEKIEVINTHLLVIWNSLTLREQSIIVSLLDKPLKRNEISNILNVSTGSISKPLTNLQHQNLIILENKKYLVSEPILKRWLNLEFKKNGNYPFKMN